MAPWATLGAPRAAACARRAKPKHDAAEMKPVPGRHMPHSRARSWPPVPRVTVRWASVLMLAALAALTLSQRSLRAQEPDLPERLRPDQMADLVAIELTPSLLYPAPEESVNVTARVRNRAAHAEGAVLVVLFAGSERIASKTIDMAAFQT